VERLVKYISLLFLLVLSIIQTGLQEEPVSNEPMPQEQRIYAFVTERPFAERTITHLYSEQIAVPVLTAGELPGYHPHHSKPKCLHTHLQKNRYAISSDNQHILHHSPCFYHVIDYYIYTLEHILI
jgi:hypothetical protein